MSLNAFLQSPLTDAQFTAFQAALPPTPIAPTPELIEYSDTLTKLTCQTSGTIEGFLPASTVVPVLKVGSDMSYLACGVSPALQTAFVAVEDQAFIVKDAVPRIGVANTGECFVKSADTTTSVEVSTGQVTIKINGVERLRINGNDTILASANGVGVDYFNIDTFGAFIGLGGTPVFYANPSNGNTRLFSPNGHTVLFVEDADDAKIQVNAVDRLVIDNTTSALVNAGHSVGATPLGVVIDNAYSLPTADGAATYVMATNGAGVASWVAPTPGPPGPPGPTPSVGLFSQTGTQTVANTAAQTSLLGTGVGTLTVPGGTFTPGMAFQYTSGGLFRDNANGTLIRFRLTNSGTLFDSGVLSLGNLNVLQAWNIDTTFVYVGGTTMITNFTFTYNTGADSRGFTTQQSNNTFNPAVSNTLDFTVQWTVANANNTITSNFGVINRIY